MNAVAMKKDESGTLPTRKRGDIPKMIDRLMKGRDEVYPGLAGELEKKLGLKRNHALLAVREWKKRHKEYDLQPLWKAVDGKTTNVLSIKKTSAAGKLIAGRLTKKTQRDENLSHPLEGRFTAIVLLMGISEAEQFLKTMRESLEKEAGM